MARILVVDDAKFMRLTLTDIFVKAGHEVVSEAVMVLRRLKNTKRQIQT